VHFGRFAGVKTKALWAVMGLMPPALFVTGALMWWNRVLQPARSRARRTLNLRLQADTTAALNATTAEIEGTN
jgi:uncharacterized iron-regulated membrane protein